MLLAVHMCGRGSSCRCIRWTPHASRRCASACSPADTSPPRALICRSCRSVRLAAPRPMLQPAAGRRTFRHAVVTRSQGVLPCAELQQFGFCRHQLDACRECLATGSGGGQGAWHLDSDAATGARGHIWLHAAALHLRAVGVQLQRAATRPAEGGGVGPCLQLESRAVIRMYVSAYAGLLVTEGASRSVTQ